MAEGVVDVTVGAPPDEVWAKLGDFGGIGEYFPGIESCRLEGDDRVIGLFGMEIRERLMTRDDEKPDAHLLRRGRGAGREPQRDHHRRARG